MPRRQVLIAVVLATLFMTLGNIASEVLFTRAFKAFDPDLAKQMGDDLDDLTSHALTSDYWRKNIPRFIVSAIIVNFGRYWWYIWLERILPTRPRPKFDPVHQRSTSRDNEVEEEKIIQDWIAQGRIRRSSVNYCNIFLKFLMDMTIGNFGQSVVWDVIQLILKWKWKQVLDPVTIAQGSGLEAVFHLFSLFPLVSFLTFIIAPAHQRIIWEDAIFLAAKVSVALVLGQLGPWVMSQEWFREAYEKGKNESLAAQNLTKATSNLTVEWVKDNLVINDTLADSAAS